MKHRKPPTAWQTWRTFAGTLLWVAVLVWLLWSDAAMVWTEATVR